MTGKNGATSGHWNVFWKKEGRSGKKGVSWSKRRIMAVLDRYVRPGMTTLDAGCGSGFFTGYFADKGCRSFALDYSEEALEYARKNTGARAEGYIKADMLSEPDFGAKYAGTFDIVFTDGLFEHFGPEDQARLMSNVRRVLKPGGVIATFCPNLLSPRQVIRPFYMPGIKEKPFTSGSLALLHAGFGILESGGLNVLPVRFSPEWLLGRSFGMIVYCIARKP